MLCNLDGFFKGILTDVNWCRNIGQGVVGRRLVIVLNMTYNKLSRTTRHRYEVLMYCDYFTHEDGHCLAHLRHRHFDPIFLPKVILLFIPDSKSVINHLLVYSSWIWTCLNWDRWRIFFLTLGCEGLLLFLSALRKVNPNEVSITKTWTCCVINRRL